MQLHKLECDVQQKKQLNRILKNTLKNKNN
jgi:hypothetical protein